MKKITIEDVAKKAGVSKGTVSAVINTKSSVKQTTRAHILKVMKEMNFRPKGVARNLKNGNGDKSIGIIIKDLNYPFYTAIASGAKDYANKKGYSVIVTSSESDHESEKKLSHLFSTKDIKGTIIAPVIEGTAEIEHLFQLKMINYPFVLLEDVKGIQANVVTIDNLEAIKKAVKYLIDNGHKKIVHFAGPPNSSHTLERIEGFRHAFSERTLVFNKKMIIPIGSNYDDSFSGALKYFKNRKSSDYPTAIVCFNDTVIFSGSDRQGALQGVRALRASLPAAGAGHVQGAEREGLLLRPAREPAFLHRLHPLLPGHVPLPHKLTL